MKRIYSLLLILTVSCSAVQKEKTDVKNENSDTTFSFMIRDIQKGSAANLSYLNHKPAGKFGWLKVKNGDFCFDNNKTIRFVGVNVVANRLFNMTHKDSDIIAKKLAALGVNMVRLHHLTPVWQKAEPFFIDRKKSTLVFSDKALEKLDYFTAALKREGIYITDEMIDSSLHPAKHELKGITSRKQKGCLKALVIFNKDAQDYAKKWIQAFYCRKNRCTGIALINDPQLALLGLLNEFSLQYHNKRLTLKLPPCYHEELNRLFQNYLSENKLKKHPFDLTLEDNTSAEFWNDLVKKGFAYWSSYLRSLGYKGPINGSNFGENIFHHEPSLNTDYLDSHLYWGYARWLRNKDVRTLNKRWSILIKEPQNEGYYTKDLFARISLASVDEKPLICSEHRTAIGGGTTSIVDPYKYSEYRALDLPFFSTVQAFQQWDGYYLFASQGPEKLGQDERMGHLLDIRHDTTYLATVPIGAYLLRSDAISKAREKVGVTFTKDDMYDFHLVPGFLNDALFYYPEIHKISCIYPGMQYKRNEFIKVLPFKDSIDLNLKNLPPVIKSDTKQFYRNWQEGWFVVDAPKAQGVEGFFFKQKAFSLQDLQLNMNSDFGVCFVIPHDNNTIKESKRMLFCVAGECRNTPEENNAVKGWMLPGKPPVIIKPVKGSLSMKNGQYSVWSLGEHGERMKQVATNTDQFDFDTGRDKTVWYELIRK